MFVFCPACSYCLDLVTNNNSVFYDGRIVDDWELTDKRQYLFPRCKRELEKDVDQANTRIKRSLFSTLKKEEHSMHPLAK